MQLVYEPTRGRFEAITAYGEGDAPKSAGLKWERTIQRWHTSDAVTANRLRDHADEGCRSRLDAALLAGVAAAEEQAAAADAARALSRATDADILVPAPEGLSYLGYQKAGIAYAAARRDTLIADEPGLGKTIQALGLANMALSDAKPFVRMLVVGPKISLWNWRRETEKWL